MSFTPRQNLMVRAYLAIAAKVGAWPKNHGGDGSSYVGEAANPAKAQGFACRNCAFFTPPAACAIVKGSVEPGALCRLHVIPQERLVALGASKPRARIQGETL